MQKYAITMSLAEHVKKFVNVVNHYDFDMDLRCGRHVVDAKSILGIFSLDLSKQITLEVNDNGDADAAKLAQLEEEIRPFLAEQE